MKNILTKNLISKTLLFFLVCFIIVGSFDVAYGVEVNQGNPSTGIEINQGNPSKSNTLQNPLKVESIGGAVNLGVEVFTYIVIIIAVLVFVWVGLKYILAQGKPDEITKATVWLGWIVAGVAIVLGARLMISIILATLDASGAVDKEVIQSANNALQKK